jgi:hypothetical protein
MSSNQPGESDLLRPYVKLRDDTAIVGKHRRAGPAVTEPVTSGDLAWAHEVALDLDAPPGEVQAAFDLIAEHSLTGDP